MKKFLSPCLALAIFAMISSPAFAHAAKDKACAPVWKACVAAGKKGKDAKSCVKTIKGGGTVDGVTVSDADAQACQGKAAAAPAPSST